MNLTAEFERQRPYLRTVALRMLGSGDDADDVLQEAWLRLDRTQGVEDPRAWLTTVTSRLCLDLLRSRRGRREVPVEIELDAPVGPSPEDEVLLAESVALALHVVMERLSPAERVAFVLHDVFELPFAQVAEVLDRSTGAVKMLASRARRRVRLRAPEDAADRAVVDAFFAAAASGDASALLALLAPDAELHAYTPDGVKVLRGAASIAPQVRAGASRGAALGPVLRPVTVGGAAGVLLVIDGRPTSVIAFTVDRGLITEIRSLPLRVRSRGSDAR
jgi:RNA polymerase sigma-70 factor, ECF subfamily